jgi:hypothetical protein
MLQTAASAAEPSMNEGDKLPNELDKVKLAWEAQS